MRVKPLVFVPRQFNSWSAGNSIAFALVSKAGSSWQWHVEIDERRYTVGNERTSDAAIAAANQAYVEIVLELLEPPPADAPQLDFGAISAANEERKRIRRAANDNAAEVIDDLLIYIDWLHDHGEFPRT